MKERLKLLRNELRLSQYEIAEKLGMSQSAYAQLENGNTKVRDRHINLICSTLNINNEWLINGTGEMFRHDINKDLGKEIGKMFRTGDYLTKQLILGLSELDEKEVEIVKILVDGLIERKKKQL